MTDLKQRVDAVDRIPVDDLWPEIRERFEDEAAGLVSPVRLDERRRRPEVGWRRALTIAAVFALLAAVGFAVVRSVISEGVPAGPPAEPKPAPVASGSFAYSLDGQVYVADGDGSNPVAITPLDRECRHGYGGYGVSWSPDGRYLAFRACDRDVITDPQGNVVGTFRAQWPGIGWSPDSSRVAVWDEYRWREGTYTIGIHGIDGTREAQIEMPRGWAGADPPYDPIWTPDGASLIVSQLEVPLDGGAPREIPFHGSYTDPSGGWWPGALAYSPDGTQMAYGTPEGLMVARADGSDPRAVSDDSAHTAAWSPNGELIAVASNDGTAADVPEGSHYEQSPNRLRVVDVATGSTTVLAEDDLTWFEVIGFSPAGDRVLFGAHRGVALQPGTFVDSIWSVRVDGSDARQIIEGTYRGAVRPAALGGGDQP